MTARLARRRTAFTVVLLILLLANLTAWGVPALADTARPEADAAGQRYAGWAMIAYPSLTEADLRAILWRQLSAGSNVVWVGHNNPGEVDATIAEPGLSYAVYEAFVDPADPRHGDAAAIVAAQVRLLRVARELGAKVVLPIGYQLQMGATWDAAHAADLRLDGRGELALDTGVPNASFYAPALRADLRRYYEWADRYLVQPYRETLLMLNLADEPSGSDYSAWAGREFAARTGYSFAQVGDDAGRQAELGRFQANQIVEYAAWAAAQWAELEPTLPTTMSFEGATARIHLQLPHVEHLFSRTPPTFYPTFDAYPRDGPPEAAIDDASLVQLFTLVRSLGHYSARYARPFWLWSTANSWGLAQASPRPANVADAVANAYYLALLARQTGGYLEGIAVWNYNAYGQGLYNDTYKTTYDPDVMFARVSESLPRVRQLLAAPAGVTRVLVLAPDRYAYRRLGADPRADPWRFRSYNFDRLLTLARNNVPAAVVPALEGENLTDITAILVLARAPDDLAAGDVDRLRAFAAAGKPVVAAEALEGALGPGEYYVGMPPEETFADSPTARDRAIWQRVLGIVDPIQGYVVATTEDALLYTIRAERTWLSVRLDFEGHGFRAASSGAAAESVATNGALFGASLDSNQYVYLTRARDEPAPSAHRR
jgi:hypothetical protein